MLKFSKYKMTKKLNKAILYLSVKMGCKARMENQARVDVVVITDP
jgi:hypothetical protein